MDHDELPPPIPPAPRFPFWVRAGHWINAIAAVLLIMSGLQIFNAHPVLYAADASDPRRVVLSLPGPLNDTATRGPTAMVLFNHTIPTGSWQMDGFPPNVTLGGWLEGGRRIHFAAAWLLLLNGLIYLVSMIMSGRRPEIWPTRKDWRGLWPAVRDHLRLPPVLKDADGRLNPLQKVTYAAVVLLLAPFLVASGLALSPGWDAHVPGWTALFGGRQLARTWHFAAMLALIAFTIGHTVLVALAGTPTLRRMITGRPIHPAEVPHAET